MSQVTAPSPVRVPAVRGAGLRAWLLRPEAPALLFLAALVVFFSITTDSFLRPSTLESIVVQVSVLGIIALAVNQVVLCGEIDISVGSMIGLCAVAVGTVAEAAGGLLLPLLAGVAVGTLAGALNGVLVTLGRIPSIIVTLGMIYALRGMVLLVTGGTWITQIPDATRVLGLSTFIGIGLPAFVLGAVFLFVSALSRHSTWGRDVFAIGGNRRAARLAGLAVDRTRFWAFVLVGSLTGLAATIFVGRAGSVQTNSGEGLELQVVAAVVIGGTSIAGGRGSPLAALTGAVLIGVILTGMVLLGVPGLWQNAVLGALILLAVSSDALRRRVTGGTA